MGKTTGDWKKAEITLDSVPWYGVYTGGMQETQAEQMTIGTLAKAAGVGVETVRFYQRKGILEKPARTAGFRKYTDADVRTIKFVKRVQELGFTLKDAQELLDLELCTQKTRPLLSEVCSAKIEEIEQKIADLQRMVGMLRRFSQTCGSEASHDGQCSLLECFENNWECCETTQRRKK
ncbi:MAG: hypothetical protein CL681_02870 [Blastopirellula sp.]|nr:hypothetical protein [Blastopirellula sp.]